MDYLDADEKETFRCRLSASSVVYDDKNQSLESLVNLCDTGAGNRVMVSKTLKHKPIVTITGSNNFVYVGKGCKLLGLKIKVAGNNNYVYIGDKVTTNGENRFFVGIGSDEAPTGVVINEDVMFASNVTIRNTDAHPIFERGSLSITNNPTNPVVIGKHTWIGESSIILKGVRIPSCSIVSTGSVMNRGVSEPSVIFGNPAQSKPIGNKVWARDNSDSALKKALKYYN
jgi:acetyltransferase-like isoleucine patch superfamily enzyme